MPRTVWLLAMAMCAATAAQAQSPASPAARPGKALPPLAAPAQEIVPAFNVPQVPPAGAQPSAAEAAVAAVCIPVPDGTPADRLTP